MTYAIYVEVFFVYICFVYCVPNDKLKAAFLKRVIGLMQVELSFCEGEPWVR